LPYVIALLQNSALNMPTYQEISQNLALVSISERLEVAEIAMLDKDVDIYRRYRKQTFNRVFYP
jgi:hypothetical protein